MQNQLFYLWGRVGEGYGGRMYSTVEECGFVKTLKYMYVKGV